MIQDFLVDVHERFNAQTYNLLTNNCNNFSNELATFLVGSGIPVRVRYSACLVLLTADC